MQINNVDPDQMPHWGVSDLSLYHLPFITPIEMYHLHMYFSFKGTRHTW